MLVLHRDSGLIEHRLITDLVDYLQAPDILVLNNTKVIPARVFGYKVASGGKVELLLLEEMENGDWMVLMKASRRPKVGEELRLCSDKVRAVLLADGLQGEARLRLESDRPLMDILDEEGVPPLPPYILRKNQTLQQIATDRERYQTVYATTPGAVAAPTAGLHFTPEIFTTLATKGIQKVELTLHVGLGTFRPVSVEQITDHEMHYEHYTVPATAASSIRAAREAGGRVVAVGSTSVRTLESVVPLRSAEGTTNIFIYPPYTFQNVDVVLTNFHLPKSTLLMMMSAFAGRETMLRTYDEAVRERYRFFSYGDCMLIL